MTLVDLTPGQVFTLTKDDWISVQHKKTKNHNQRFGMAIDNHVKQIAKATGADIPENQYCEYDFAIGTAFFDIKSHGNNSVSISHRELKFAQDRISEGSDFIYIVFKQLYADQFEFEGMVRLKDLLAANKIYPSQFSGVYFRVGQARKYFLSEDTV